MIFIDITLKMIYFEDKEVKGMNSEETRTFELGMQARKASIPATEQCENCGGAGHVSIGCAFTEAVYGTCPACEGSGLQAVATYHMELEARMALLLARSRT